MCAESQHQVWNNFFFTLKISGFAPENGHLREVMILMFHQKKKAADCREFLHKVHDDRAPSIWTAGTWFRRFKNDDSSVDAAERSGRPSAVNTEDRQAILDENNTQSQGMKAEQPNEDRSTISRRQHAMETIQKSKKWVSHELTHRQVEERKVIWEMQLHRRRRKEISHRIMTGDEWWDCFEHPKRQKTWVNPGQPSTSTAEANRFGRRVNLCVW